MALRIKPDVIILDTLLPDLSDWEVLIELKAHPLTCTIPVLIVSVVDEWAKGLALGAAAYLFRTTDIGSHLSLERRVEQRCSLVMLIAQNLLTISLNY